MNSYRKNHRDFINIFNKQMLLIKIGFCMYCPKMHAQCLWKCLYLLDSTWVYVCSVRHRYQYTLLFPLVCDFFDYIHQMKNLDWNYKFITRTKLLSYSNIACKLEITSLQNILLQAQILFLTIDKTNNILIWICEVLALLKL